MANRVAEGVARGVGLRGLVANMEVEIVDSDLLSAGFFINCIVRSDHGRHDVAGFNVAGVTHLCVPIATTPHTA